MSKSDENETPKNKQIERGVESAIRAAIERGEFDNLKGKGKPLNLNDYFDTPEDSRLGYSVLKNAGFIPEEVELLNEIGDIKEKIKLENDPAVLAELKKKLVDRQLKYNLLMDRQKRIR